MNVISNRFRLVLCCAVFNLLFEYSARGFRQFVGRPVFVLVLFGIYLTYFLMLEDLMVRLKLTNYQVFVVAFVYGLLPTAFLTGNLFNPDIYGGLILAGVNVGTVVVIGVLAWGVVQGMVTLYFANRVSPRDWDHARMGKLGWVVCIVYQLAVMIAAGSNPVTPRGTALGYGALGILAAGGIVLFVKSVTASRAEPRPFQPSWVMDVLAFGSVLVFLALGTLFASGPTVVTSQPLNVFAVTLENVWVFLCGIVFFAYRWRKGSDVAI